VSDNTRSMLMTRSILDAATLLFDDRGYAETRMQDIADSMGVTRPTLYYYFKNKEEILIALLLELISADKVLESVDDPERTAYDRLRDLLRRIGAQVVEQPARLRIVNRNYAQVPEQFQQDFSAQRRRVRAAMTRTLEEAIATGAVRPVDPKLTTSIIFGAITGIPDWYHYSDPVTAGETVEAIVTMLLDGITVPDGDRHDGTAPSVIKHMSEDLSYLQRLLESDSRTS
jgi:AcrR family transcriptional regulator